MVPARRGRGSWHPQVREGDRDGAGRAGLARDLTGKEIKVLMLDGEHMAGRCVIVALAITAGGEQFPVGLWDSATENTTA